jgi:hypothetical protein
VLVIRGECDRVVPPQIAPKTAARYQRGTYVEIPRADHLAVSGEALPVTMGHIDDWIAKSHVFGLSAPESETAPGFQSRGPPDESRSV